MKRNPFFITGVAHQIKADRQETVTNESRPSVSINIFCMHDFSLYKVPGGGGGGGIIYRSPPFRIHVISVHYCVRSELLVLYPHKRGPTTEYQPTHPTPYFGLNFLLRSNECAPMCICPGKKREYFDVKIFSDSMACAIIKRTKYMRNINNNAVQGRLSENYLTRKIIA